MMWSVVAPFVAFSIVTAVEPLKAPKHEKITEKIEVKVGDKDIITSTDIQSLVDAIRPQYPNETDEALHKKAVQQLIEQTLIEIYLDKSGMGITDRDVDQRINSIRASNGIQTNDDFKNLLGKQGLTFDRFRIQLKRQMEQMQFRGVVQRQVAKPTDEDLKMFYKNNENRFKTNPEVELVECVIPFGPKPADTEKIAKKFQEKPKTFDTCVKKYSVSPSKSNKGVLGVFQRGMLREDLDQKIFALKKDDVLLTKLPGAFQLIKIEKWKNLGPQTFESAKDKIEELIREDTAEKEESRIMNELKASNFVQIL